MHHDKDNSPAYYAGWSQPRQDHQTPDPQQQIYQNLDNYAPRLPHMMQQEYQRQQGFNPTQLPSLPTRLPHNSVVPYQSPREANTANVAPAKRKGGPEEEPISSTTESREKSADKSVEGRKPKRKRAQQACLRCRTQKLRCDGVQPCGRCSALGRTAECAFEQPPGYQVSTSSVPVTSPPKTLESGIEASSVRPNSTMAKPAELPRSNVSPTEGRALARVEADSTSNPTFPSALPAMNSDPTRRYLAAPPVASFPMPHQRHHSNPYYPTTSISAPPTSSTRTTASYPIDGANLLQNVSSQACPHTVHRALTVLVHSKQPLTFERVPSLAALNRPPSSSGRPASAILLQSNPSDTDRPVYGPPLSSRPMLSPPTITATSPFALDMSLRLSRMESLLENVVTALRSHGGESASPSGSPLDERRPPLGFTNLQLHRSGDHFPPRLAYPHPSSHSADSRQAVIGSQSMPELYNSRGPATTPSGAELPCRSDPFTQAGNRSIVHVNNRLGSSGSNDMAATSNDGGWMSHYKRDEGSTRSATPDRAEMASGQSTASSASKRYGRVEAINGLPAYDDAEEIGGDEHRLASTRGRGDSHPHGRASPSRVLGVGATQQAVPPKTGETLHPVIDGVVSTARAQELLSIFQMHCLPIMPILDVNSSSLQEREHASLVTTILAIASCLGPTLSPNTPRSSVQPTSTITEEHDRLVRLTHTHLGQMLCKVNHTLEDVQAVVFLATWSIGPDEDRSDPWILTELAARMARKLGINEGSIALEDSSSPLSSSWKTRLMLCMLDSFIGNGPSVIPDLLEKSSLVVENVRKRVIAESERKQSVQTPQSIVSADAFVAAHLDLSIISRPMLDASKELDDGRLPSVPSGSSKWSLLDTALNAWHARWITDPLMLQRQQRRIALLRYAHIRLCLAVLMLNGSSSNRTDPEGIEKVGSSTRDADESSEISRSSALHAAWLIVRLHLGTNSSDVPLSYAPDHLIKSLAQAAISFCHLSTTEHGPGGAANERTEGGVHASRSDPLTTGSDENHASHPTRAPPSARTVTQDALRALDSLSSSRAGVVSFWRRRILDAQAGLDSEKLPGKQASEQGQEHPSNDAGISTGRTATQYRRSDNKDLTTLLFGP